MLPSAIDGPSPEKAAGSWSRYINRCTCASESRVWCPRRARGAPNPEGRVEAVAGSWCGCGRRCGPAAGDSLLKTASPASQAGLDRTGPERAAGLVNPRGAERV